MEEHEKVESNDSNESGKKYQLWRENMVLDPGLSLSPYMK